MSSVASLENGVVVMWREPGARTWEPSIVPEPVSRDAATPRASKSDGSQMKMPTMFMRIRTIRIVMENPKSRDSEPMRNGGMMRLKNRTGGSVTV